MITLTETTDLDLAETGDARLPRHLSAASSLACAGSFIYVVADDELHLGVFVRAGIGRAPAPPVRWRLPADKTARKRQKPDLKRSRGCRALAAIATVPCSRSAGSEQTAVAARCCG
jgi:hypothetical protein